ncbi:MAG: ATP-binding protein [Treponema sp.]|jgi:AAA15 family ATPase/GTPase|nr:ATP-binding protein [Treponema sp.]
MIAEFSVENFRSFKEKCTFSLISTKDNKLSESNAFESGKNLRFLKSAVIYGANASGKSNFFNALIFFLNFSVNSGPRKQIGDPIETEPFALSKQTESAPSRFEIIFFIKDGDEEIRYRYGLAVSKERVEAEYLFAVNNVREVTLFTRSLQETNYTSNFKEGARGKPSVRNNCTFLSVCAQNNGEISALIVKYFRSITVLSGLYDQIIISKKEGSQPNYKKKIVDFLKNADMQITNYKAESIPAFNDFPDPEVSELLKRKFPNAEQERILFGHTVYDNETPAGEKYLDGSVESSGTRKLFSYSDDILGALEEGTPLFIDEFDTMLHPLIIEGIVKLFNSPITNLKNAQFVISCHAVNIMTNKLFRRDQIWFCEKDQYGATDLYSLVEYKEPVRKDASYNKNYLQGKYGAIPYLNEILLQTGLENNGG